MNIIKIAEFIGHKDCVYNLEKNDATHFISVAGDGMVVKWNINNPDEGELIAKFPNSIYALHELTVAKTLIVGQNFAGIHLIDITDKKELRSLKLTDSYIFDIQHFESMIFVACGNGDVIIVDANTFIKIHTIKVCEKSARSISINPILKEFAVGYSDFNIRIFSFKNFELLNTLVGHTNSVFTVKYSPDFKYILTAGRDAQIKIWNCWNHYELQKSIPAHLYAINHVDFAPNGQYFASASMDKSIKIWDCENFKLLKVIDKSRHAGHGTSVNKLLWLDNKKLISCSDDRKISLWDMK